MSCDFFFVGSILNTPADHYIKRRLFSYFSRPLNDALRCTEKGERLFLDSGAFTAYMRGVDIDIDEYAAFVKDTKEHWAIVANLDVIPRRGECPAYAARKSYRNQRYLEDAGCNVVPCFHFAEPAQYLERYIDEYDYIALGGMVKGRQDVLRSWLDWCWRSLTDDEGEPLVKVHGFGLSAHWAATRYPWASLDSTSWMIDSVRRPEPICRVWVNGSRCCWMFLPTHYRQGSLRPDSA